MRSVGSCLVHGTVGGFQCLVQRFDFGILNLHHRVLFAIALMKLLQFRCFSRVSLSQDFMTGQNHLQFFLKRADLMTAFVDRTVQRCTPPDFSGE